MDGTAEKLIRIIKMTKEDSKFRAKLLKNPKKVLDSFGIQVTDEKSLIIEYHDNYGLFIGLPMTFENKINIPEDSQHHTFTEHHFMDCLHH
jgi:hypothetical protein